MSPMLFEGTTGGFVLRLLGLVVSVVALLAGSMLAYEAILLGPLATPERIAAYYFGSEAVVGHGGIAYRSRENYVLLTAIPAILLLTSAGTGFVGALCAKRVLCYLSLLCTAVAAAVVFGI